MRDQLRLTVVLSLALGVLLFSVGGISPSSAQAVTSAAPAVVVNKLQPDAVHANTAGAPAPPVYTNNWSGYVATGKTFSKVQSWFIVPKVTCTVPNAQTSIWAGLDGYNGSTVEQAGIEVVCAGTNGKTPQYNAWWEMYPTNVEQRMPLSVAPGDVMVVNVNYASGKYLLQVVNNTLHTSSSKTVACATGITCSRSTAEWVIERPMTNGVYDELGDWGMMYMYSDTAASTGSLEPLASYDYQAIDMINGNNGAMAIVSALAPTGKSFNDSWKSAQ